LRLSPGTLAERSASVGHVTIYRWVQRFTPEFYRGRPAASARSLWPVVRRWDLCEGRRAVAIRL